ncbi:hypothetical protein L1987_66838 [Smallanthus sonchifolius]|uniref:Uncharacterized protein n=1 Tax=Smallanthus sonchifolius TaxID=185202 RepID=A0ACB9BYH4_9ASTR|nr:hypothetical protein L1987_66838 [Smallanthus sonchifolius]
MKEVVTDDFDGVLMVMEYVDHKLKHHMERMKQPFNQSEVKRLMMQLLEGVSYLHDNYVMHRDLKTSNLLLNNNVQGPRTSFGDEKLFNCYCMWSVGCIMAKLLSKKPLFDGITELEQIDKIFRTLGTPNELTWPGYSKLPGVMPNFVKQRYNNLRNKFPIAVFTGSPALTELGIDLLSKFLTYDPEKRITAKQAFDHGWFHEAPLPAERLRICK